MMNVLLPTLVLAIGQQTDPPIPSNMKQLECAVHEFAVQYGSRYPNKIPAMNVTSLSDALRLWDCNGTIAQKAKPARDLLNPPSSYQNSWFVAVKGGSDVSGKGSLDSPWKTISHALATLPPSADRRSLYLREGTYYLNKTLSLGVEHSRLTISAYVTSKGTEKVTLSGAGGGISGWQCSNLIPGCKVYETKVSLPKRVDDGPEIVNQLFANGKRMLRARFPNGDPAENSGKCFSQPQYAGEHCNWLTAKRSIDIQNPGREIRRLELGPNRGESPTVGCEQCKHWGTFKYKIYDPPVGHPVYNKPLPGIGWSNNSYFSPWRSLFERPADINVADGTFPREWKTPSTGVAHVLHTKLWGGWMYKMSKRSGNKIDFAYGGYQESRGHLEGIDGNRFYVENLIEELDAPGEWFYDESDDMLYLYPNSTVGGFPEVSVPLLDTLISVKGANDVNIEGLTFTQTRATYLDQHEVPSGGDWTIHRGAAVFIEDCHQVKISSCEFIETGGNGLMLSNNVTFSVVESNEFYRTGDSSIISLGSTQAIDGMKSTYPMNNTIAFNHIHEYGIYGKQTSCYFQSLTANSTIIGNICYNGPRAGFNFNDGFGGAYLITENLLFNHVRETADHGPINSWDRQPYLTKSGVDDGFPADKKLGLVGSSIVKSRSHVKNNFIMNGYSSVWTIDHDDGSQFYNDTSNFMLWGGCKNYLGNSKTCSHNLIVYPGIPNRSVWGTRCQTDDSPVFGNQYFMNNTCITGDGVFYSFKCKHKEKKDIGKDIYEVCI